MDLHELTRIFEELGAEEPNSWARSQIEEGIPQLARFLFLKGCWDLIVPDNDDSWIDKYIEASPEGSNEPYDGVGQSLRNLLKCGAKRSDIVQLVRGMQAELMFSICYQMDDSGSVEGNDYVDWALVQLNDDGEIIDFIGGLHESVLGTDPTGREMRPK